MNRKIFVGIAAVTLAVTLTGCSQVHFGKDAVTIGEVKQNKKTVNVKKAKSAKVQSSSSKKIKPKKDSKKKIKENKKNKTKKSAVVIWNTAKTAKLKTAVNNWGKKSGQTYQFYDGKKNLKTKKGATYPGVLATNRFVLNTTVQRARQNMIIMCWQLLMMTLNLGTILTYSALNLISRLSCLISLGMATQL